MDEIEYLEEYEDLILPTMSAQSAATKNRSKSNLGSMPDDEDSSSIDQDIFDSLFDDNSDDETLLQKKGTAKLSQRSERSSRISMDSLDMLVKELGEPFNPQVDGAKSANKSVPKTSNVKSTPSQISKTVQKLPTTTSNTKSSIATTSSAVNIKNSSKTDLTSATTTSAIDRNTKAKSVATVRPTVQQSLPQATTSTKAIPTHSNDLASSRKIQTSNSGGIQNAKVTSGSTNSAKVASSAPSTSRKQISTVTSTTGSVKYSATSGYNTNTIPTKRLIERSQTTIIKPEKPQIKDPAEDPLSLENVEREADSDSDSFDYSDISADTFVSLSDLEEDERQIIELSNDSNYERLNLDKIRGSTPSPTVSDDFKSVKDDSPNKNSPKCDGKTKEGSAAERNAKTMTNDRVRHYVEGQEASTSSQRKSLTPKKTSKEISKKVDISPGASDTLLDRIDTILSGVTENTDRDGDLLIVEKQNDDAVMVDMDANEVATSTVDDTNEKSVETPENSAKDCVSQGDNTTTSKAKADANPEPSERETMETEMEKIIKEVIEQEDIEMREEVKQQNEEEIKDDTKDKETESNITEEVQEYDPPEKTVNESIHESELLTEVASEQIVETVENIETTEIVDIKQGNAVQIISEKLDKLVETEVNEILEAEGSERVETSAASDNDIPSKKSEARKDLPKNIIETKNSKENIKNLAAKNKNSHIAEKIETLANELESKSKDTESSDYNEKETVNQQNAIEKVKTPRRQKKPAQNATPSKRSTEKILSHTESSKPQNEKTQVYASSSKNIEDQHNEKQRGSRKGSQTPMKAVSTQSRSQSLEKHIDTVTDVQAKKDPSKSSDAKNEYEAVKAKIQTEHNRTGAKNQPQPAEDKTVNGPKVLNAQNDDTKKGDEKSHRHRGNKPSTERHLKKRVTELVPEDIKKSEYDKNVEPKRIEKKNERDRSQTSHSGKVQNPSAEQSIEKLQSTAEEAFECDKNSMMGTITDMEDLPSEAKNEVNLVNKSSENRETNEDQLSEPTTPKQDKRVRGLVVSLKKTDLSKILNEKLFRKISRETMDETSADERESGTNDEICKDELNNESEEPQKLAESITEETTMPSEDGEKNEFESDIENVEKPISETTKDLNIEKNLDTSKKCSKDENSLDILKVPFTPERTRDSSKRHGKSKSASRRERTVEKPVENAKDDVKHEKTDEKSKEHLKDEKIADKAGSDRKEEEPTEVSKKYFKVDKYTEKVKRNSKDEKSSEKEVSRQEKPRETAKKDSTDEKSEEIAKKDSKDEMFSEKPDRDSNETKYTDKEKKASKHKSRESSRDSRSSHKSKRSSKNDRHSEKAKAESKNVKSKEKPNKDSNDMKFEKFGNAAKAEKSVEQIEVDLEKSADETKRTSIDEKSLEKERSEKYSIKSVDPSKGVKITEKSSPHKSVGEVKRDSKDVKSKDNEKRNSRDEKSASEKNSKSKDHKVGEKPGRDSREEKYSRRGRIEEKTVIEKEKDHSNLSQIKQQDNKPSSSQTDLVEEKNLNEKSKRESKKPAREIIKRDDKKANTNTDMQEKQAESTTDKIMAKDREDTNRADTQKESLQTASDKTEIKEKVGNKEAEKVEKTENESTTPESSDNSTEKSTKTENSDTSKAEATVANESASETSSPYKMRERRAACGTPKPNQSLNEKAKGKIFVEENAIEDTPKNAEIESATKIKDGQMKAVGNSDKKHETKETTKNAAETSLEKSDKKEDSETLNKNTDESSAKSLHAAESAKTISDSKSVAEVSSESTRRTRKRNEAKLEEKCADKSLNKVENAKAAEENKLQKLESKSHTEVGQEKNNERSDDANGERQVPECDEKSQQNDVSVEKLEESPALETEEENKSVNKTIEEPPKTDIMLKETTENLNENIDTTNTNTEKKDTTNENEPTKLVADTTETSNSNKGVPKNAESVGKKETENLTEKNTTTTRNNSEPGSSGKSKPRSHRSRHIRSNADLEIAAQLSVASTDDEDHEGLTRRSMRKRGTEQSPSNKNELKKKGFRSPINQTSTNLTQKQLKEQANTSHRSHAATPTTGMARKRVRDTSAELNETEKTLGKKTKLDTVRKSTRIHNEEMDTSEGELDTSAAQRRAKPTNAKETQPNKSVQEKPTKSTANKESKVNKSAQEGAVGAISKPQQTAKQSTSGEAKPTTSSQNANLPKKSVNTSISTSKVESETAQSKQQQQQKPISTALKTPIRQSSSTSVPTAARVEAKADKVPPVGSTADPLQLPVKRLRRLQAIDGIDQANVVDDEMSKRKALRATTQTEGTKSAETQKVAAKATQQQHQHQQQQQQKLSSKLTEKLTDTNVASKNTIGKSPTKSPASKVITFKEWLEQQKKRKDTPGVEAQPTFSGSANKVNTVATATMADKPTAHTSTVNEVPLLAVQATKESENAEESLAEESVTKDQKLNAIVRDVRETVKRKREIASSVSKAKSEVPAAAAAAATTVAKQATPTTKETTPVVKQSIYAGKQITPVAKETMLAARETIPTENQLILAAKETTTAFEDANPPTKQRRIEQSPTPSTRRPTQTQFKRPSLPQRTSRLTPARLNKTATSTDQRLILSNNQYNEKQATLHKLDTKFKLRKLRVRINRSTVAAYYKKISLNKANETGVQKMVTTSRMPPNIKAGNMALANESISISRKRVALKQQHLATSGIPKLPPLTARPTVLAAPETSDATKLTAPMPTLTKVPPSASEKSQTDRQHLSQADNQFGSTEELSLLTPMKSANVVPATSSARVQHKTTTNDGLREQRTSTTSSSDASTIARAQLTGKQAVSQTNANNSGITKGQQVPFTPIVPKEEVVDEHQTPTQDASSRNSSATTLDTTNSLASRTLAIAAATNSALNQSSSADASGYYGLTPTSLDSNGTRLYSFLHPAKYNRNHGCVLLDYCCPNLDGPMPAIDPTRIHAQVQAGVRELPAYIVMTTKLITRADLEANKNVIPASIRQKVEKITADASNSAANQSNSAVTSGTPNVPVTMPPATAPVPVTKATLTPTITALQKHLPSTTIITPKLMPPTSTSTMASQQLQQLTPHNALNNTSQSSTAPASHILNVSDYQRSLLRSSVRLFDARLKKYYYRVALLSFSDRQAIIDGIINSTTLTPKDVDCAVRLLDEYAAQITGLPAANATNKSNNNSAQAIQSVSNAITTSTTQTLARTTTIQQQQKQNQYNINEIAVIDKDSSLLGYHMTSSSMAMSKSTISTRSSIMSTSVTGVKNMTLPNMATTSSGGIGIQPMKTPQDSPRIFYTKPPIQTSTPIATTTSCGGTPQSDGKTVSLRSTQRLCREVTIRQIPNKLGSTSISSTSATATPSNTRRLPTLTRNPHLTPVNSSGDNNSSSATETITTRSAVTISTAPKRMTRASAAAKVIVITQNNEDSSPPLDECILPDGHNNPEIKRERVDDEFVG